MSNIRILHYRDRNIGGKFDGNCWVNTGKNSLAQYTSFKIRFMIRIEPFTEDFQYLLGAGPGNNQISIRINREGSDYSLAVFFTGEEIELTKIPDINKILTFEIHFERQTEYVQNIRTYINEYAYDYEDLSSLTKQHYYDNPITSAPFFIGASSIGFNGGYTALAGNRFTGTVFHYEIENEVCGDHLPNFPYWESQKLCFYPASNINNINDQSGNNYDAEIISRPSDFWGDETDLSSYISEKNDAEISCKSDDYWVKSAETFKFELFNFENEIKVGDSIVVEIDGDIIGLYNINNIKIKHNGLYLEIESEGFLQQLETVSPLLFSSKSEGYPSGQFLTKNHWWSIQDYYDDTEIHGYAISLTSLLHKLIYFLDYYRLISFYGTNLSLTESPYYDCRLTTGEFIPLTYNKIGFSTKLFESINISEYGEITSISMAQILSTILTTLRLSYYISSGNLIFYRISYSREDIEFIEEKKKDIIEAKKYKVTTNILELDTKQIPDIDRYYLVFDKDDFSSIEIKNNKHKNINTLTIEDSFWLYYVTYGGVGSPLSIKEFGDNENPAIYSYNHTFLRQLYSVLLSELGALFEIEEITTDLSYIDSRNIFKEYDINLSTRKMKIIQRSQ